MAVNRFNKERKVLERERSIEREIIFLSLCLPLRIFEKIHNNAFASVSEAIHCHFYVLDFLHAQKTQPIELCPCRFRLFAHRDSLRFARPKIRCNATKILTNFLAMIFYLSP